MQNSGTKLVLALTGLALLLGVVSWWYRYETARRASQFWGPQASRLIAESEGFEAIRIGSDGPIETQVTDLSEARGQAHLRHAFLSDSNYVWETQLNHAEIKWYWSLRFYEGKQQTDLLLSENLDVIGKSASESQPGVALSCEPMAASLKPYFDALGLLAKPADASTASE